ncbi:hypothetical protein T484DRAFT_1774259 [Baffinella frigidus]|nr:hypothetical protein T484DRAFT_1774259 [Cryptophyta sp. CCMP2293]
MQVTGGQPEEDHRSDIRRRGWSGSVDDPDGQGPSQGHRGAPATNGVRVWGVAERWNEKGFGFIRPDEGGDDLFCHVTAILDGTSLAPGARVQYVRVWDDRRNKEEAADVTGGSQEEAADVTGGSQADSEYGDRGAPRGGEYQGFLRVRRPGRRARGVPGAGRAGRAARRAW